MHKRTRPSKARRNPRVRLTALLVASGRDLAKSTKQGTFFLRHQSKSSPKETSLSLWYFTKTPSLICDNRGHGEAAGCHQQKNLEWNNAGPLCQYASAARRSQEGEKRAQQMAFSHKLRGTTFHWDSSSEGRRWQRRGMTAQMLRGLGLEGLLNCIVNKVKVWCLKAWLDLY